MPRFDEDVFIKALTERPEDARKFSTSFNPHWLENPELIPLTEEIYAFTKKEKIPPSIETLKKIFLLKDPEAYKLRFSSVFDRLEKVNPDLSMVLFTLNQARDVAISRSFYDLATNAAMQNKQESFDGSGILKDVARWFRVFSDSDTDRTMNLKDAVEELMAQGHFEPMAKVPTGIDAIDRFCGGGLRAKQTGIVLAGTGQGKSAVLITIAHKMSAVQNKKVWFITNELSTEELTERLLARLTGKDLEDIIEDPKTVYDKDLSRFWKSKLHERCLFTEYMREVSVDQIESDYARNISIYGWKPDVIVIDYMERLKPSLMGYSRDKEWQWMGAVAKDLVRLAKRENLIIWTAAQANREGLRKGVSMELAHAQGSIRHLQEVTAVLSIKQVPVPGNDDEILMEFMSQKQRQSKNPLRPLYVKCNLATMHISNEEVDLQKLVEESDEEDNPLTPLQKQKASRK